jgi:ubiquitin-conjugating enzyme E2 J2
LFASVADLPNMGEKERGKPDVAQESQLQSSTSASSTTSPMSLCSMANPASFTTQGLVPSQQSAALINGRPNSNGKPEDPARPVGRGWQTAWRFVYEKWRLCAFIALAIIVSRFSTMG